MVKSHLVEQLVTVKGNEPLLLTDSEKVWFIKSGSLALFATLVEEGEPKGNRSYLFGVRAGEALFGAALTPGLKPEEERGMMAVALEETELLPIALADLVAQIEAGEQSAIAVVEEWVQHLGEWSSDRQQYNLPANLVPAQGTHFLSLLKGQSLKPQGEKVAWVDVREGNTSWMGVEQLPLGQASPILPLATSMWLTAASQVEISTTPGTELENPQELSASLALLHAYFFTYFNLIEQQQLEAEYQRFQEREKVNIQVAEGALGQLAGVLYPQEVEFVQEGTSLLVAAGAVGRALGITINPPAQSEDLNRVKDPLEAIARASQFRTRRVLLVGNWWEEEYGPLLAYTYEDKRPLAILPDKGKGNRYILFDPESRTRTPVDETVAETVGLEAYVFYRPLPAVVRNTAEIFRFGVKGYEKELALVVLFGLIGTLLGMITPQATAVLVNNAIPDSDRILLLQLGLALFAAAIGQSAFQLAQGIISLRVENAADGVLQPATWNRLLGLKPAFFRQFSSGDLLNRLLAVSQIRRTLSGATQRTLLSGVFALLNLVLMFVYSVKLALVGLGLTILAIAVTATSSMLLVRKQRKQEEIEGTINGLTVELINGVAKLRVAAAEQRAFAAWAQKYSQTLKIKSGIQRINDAVSVFNEALPLVTSVLLFWFAVVFIESAQAKGLPGGLTVGTFLAFNAAFGIFIGGATDLSNTMTDILEIVPLWERAGSILQSETESDPTKADPGRLTGRLALEHVTFRYREDGPLILDDVSVYAEPGEFIALVGPSGSGKSTVFRLLLGFETPLSGTVYYDGQDLAGLDIQAVRRQLGVVLQNGRISSAPIFDSITAGALVSLDEAWEAARMAGFAEDIEQMPMGMHTVISEGGSNLSGGQRQRLLIARSLVLKPKIILMDEATSALDNRTQSIVTESLDRLNATRVVIAHRLSTIRNADRIYVIEAGRVVQVGTFEELVNQEGLFARLVARQLD
jgi:NHLM bacteriocin system ABC transporter ATP-binding protein